MLPGMVIACCSDIFHPREMPEVDALHRASPTQYHWRLYPEIAA
jgi:hypothetical protein